VKDKTRSEVDMSFRAIFVAAAFLLVALFAATAEADTGRIYAKIYTDQGDVLEGPIRWDKNEASWDDIIDGYKDTSSREKASKRHKYSDKEEDFSFFGITIGGDWLGSRTSGIAFGHIKKLTPDGDDGAELLLKSGREVLIGNSSTDLGSSLRELIIETKTEGELELAWDDIEYIEFMDGGDVQSSFGDRIFGTVTTSRAGEFTGWICWDVDELFGSDIIDGREGARKRKVKFSNIARIEKVSSQAALVVTKDGKEMRLDDSNDVDSGNRGIVISDLKLGRVTVSWDEFESLDIKTPAATDFVTYNSFDGGRPLTGTVYDEDGTGYTGTIRWDGDEEYTWELLDGTYRDVEFDITFEHIKSIEKLSRRTCRVTLWDDRQIRLGESNDVDSDINGIFVIGSKDKDEAELDWEDFDRVEFVKR
jgi:hypothetical protein